MIWRLLVIAPLLAASLLIVCIVLGYVLLVWGPPHLWPHRSALLDAFDGQIDPCDSTRYEFIPVNDCRNAEYLTRLPPATDARCVTWLAWNGACCHVYFPFHAEVHVHAVGDGRYDIAVIALARCLNPDYNPEADPDSPDARPFIRCQERQ